MTDRRPRAQSDDDPGRARRAGLRPRPTARSTLDVVSTIDPDPDLDGLLAELRRHAEADDWSTLPPGVYCSDEIWQLEVERVFRPGWVNVGHVSEVPEPGDIKAVDVVGEPMVMTRDRDGAVQVLSRVCTHR